MKKLSQREQLILVLCILFLVAFGVKIVVGNFSFRTESAIEEDIARETSRLAKYINAANRKAKIDDIHLKLFEPYLQEGSEEQITSRLVSDVQKEAEKFNIQILNLKPERVIEKGIFIEYPLRMTVAGEWEDVVAWIHQLQGEPYFLDIEQMRLEKSTSTSEMLKARLTLTYFRVKI